MENNIKLGKAWQQVRKAKGYTQTYASEKINLGPRYISDLERDLTIGSIPVLINLCNLYEITPTYILQDYLKIKNDQKIDSRLIGFYSLNERDKEIVLELIKSMNQKKEHE